MRISDTTKVTETLRHLMASTIGTRFSVKVWSIVLEVLDGVSMAQCRPRDKGLPLADPYFIYTRRSTRKFAQRAWPAIALRAPLTHCGKDVALHSTLFLPRL
jgi:hypothetical protein